MGIQVQGNGGVVAEVDGTNYRSLRTTVRPLDHGSLGHYRLSTTVALVVSQAANGTLFSFRWGHATNKCVLTYLRLSCLQTSAATATIMPSFEVVLARAFTASDSAGTAITLTGNNMKKRTSMGTTLVTDIRKAAVAAGLTAGTRALDAEPVLQMATSQLVTTPNSIIYEKELDLTNSVDHPIIFDTNEGFIIRGPSVVFGLAGTANLLVDLCWAEVAAY
jgi:hypothetical protein